MHPLASPAWPDLPFDAWHDTLATLHLWTQIVGKVKLAQTPWLNHSWHVALHVTARGLSTGPVPHGHRTFGIDFDFVEHALRIETADPASALVPLRPQSVADFHAAVMAALQRLDLPVRIDGMPTEIADAVRFEADVTHAAYDPEYATRLWRVLLQSDRVFQAFRTRFIGKSSPVHFFWGSFDLAVTRFSGRPAPPHPGGVPHLSDAVVREAYSHEVSSAGFWPGGGPIPYPAFYAYAYPEPTGYATSAVRPAAAFYSEQMREFVLPYDAVRTAADPDAVLLDFLQSTYEAAAERGAWSRGDLESAPGLPGIPRPLRDRPGTTLSLPRALRAGTPMPMLPSRRQAGPVRARPTVPAPGRCPRAW